jgi:hypothetical protein
MSKIDFKLVTNVSVDGIDTNDYPDFVDAFIVSADYDGEPMSDEMIDEINSDYLDFVSECVYHELF